MRNKAENDKYRDGKEQLPPQVRQLECINYRLK
jgi:hypothetical protein